jgi:uncharacterized protein YggL (DUF469 family)
MNISELKSLIQEVLNEMNPAHLEPMVDTIKSEVEKLFNENETYVDYDDISNIIYSHIKDVAQAESVQEEILTFADQVAKDKGYVYLGSDGYVKKYELDAEDELSKLDESKRKILTSLIKESIEEIKLETQKSIEESMVALDKVVKEYSKDYGVNPSKRGGYEICGCLPHHFHIRPNYMDSYDVIYMKDGADRTRHMNASLDELKKFVKEKLNEKGNYVQKAYNKSAEQSKDQVKKEELPSTKQNPVKSLDDKKNEQKDYKEDQVKKEEDLPDKPMKEVGKVNKQSEHPIEGEKVKYTYPKQDKKEKKHVLKGGKGKELNLPAHKIKSK